MCIILNLWWKLFIGFDRWLFFCPRDRWAITLRLSPFLLPLEVILQLNSCGDFSPGCLFYTLSALSQTFLLDHPPPASNCSYFLTKKTILIIAVSLLWKWSPIYFWQLKERNHFAWWIKDLVTSSLSLFYREGFKVCYQHSHGTQQINPNNFSDPRPDLSSSAGQGFDLSFEICQNLLLGGLQMAFGVAR